MVQFKFQFQFHVLPVRLHHINAKMVELKVFWKSCIFPNKQHVIVYDLEQQSKEGGPYQGAKSDIDKKEEFMVVIENFFK